MQTECTRPLSSDRCIFNLIYRFDLLSVPRQDGNASKASFLPVHCRHAMQKHFQSRLERFSRQKGLEHLQGHLRLVRRDHVSPVDHLQKGQSVAGARHSGSGLPVVGTGGIEVGLVTPLEVLRPGFVAEVVTNEIDVSGVHESGKASLQELGHVVRKVLHPVDAELGVDPKIAGLPAVTLGFVDIESLFRGFAVQPLLDMAEIVTQGSDLALFANVVGIEARRLVGDVNAMLHVTKAAWQAKLSMVLSPALHW